RGQQLKMPSCPVLGRIRQKGVPGNELEIGREGPAVQRAMVGHPQAWLGPDRPAEIACPPAQVSVLVVEEVTPIKAADLPKALGLDEHAGPGNPWHLA